MKRIVLFASLVLFCMAGCGEFLEKTEMVPIEKVPESVMKVAKEKLPGVKFESAWKEKVGGKTVYEVRGKSADGKTRDIKVSPDGTVLEVD